MNEELETIICSIIGNAGEAKSLSYEALNASIKGDFEKSDNLIKEAEKAILKVHNIQTTLIQKEASGEKLELSMLFIHAQDHIMTAITENELIKKMILQNKKIKELEDIIKNN